jgi:hypothetical protein
MDCEELSKLPLMGLQMSVLPAMISSSAPVHSSFETKVGEVIQTRKLSEKALVVEIRIK